MNTKDDLYKQVLKLRKSGAYRKAYTDAKFINRDELRPLRLHLELLKPEMILSEHGVKSTIVIFGSARIWSMEESEERVQSLRKMFKKNPLDNSLKKKLKAAMILLKSHVYYEEAKKFSELVSENGSLGGHKFIVVTGGGPGIMEAANRGAYESGSKSIGLNITLPMEQGPNPYVSPEFCFRFHYFAIRKMHFVMRAKALVVFPGGFGTMDELFEVLTLVQTGKKRKLPIILVGKEYWKKAINFKAVAEHGYISEEDLSLFQYAETAEEAWKIIVDFYKKHSLH